MVAALDTARSWLDYDIDAYAPSGYNASHLRQVAGGVVSLLRSEFSLSP
jgi:hypothetical protein